MQIINNIKNHKITNREKFYAVLLKKVIFRFCARNE